MSMSEKNERRLKLAAQGLRKTALSLQAAVVSLLQAAEALTAETDDNLVDNSPLDANLQDLLIKGNINGVLNKLFGEAFNNEGETLDKDQKTQQSANGAKRPTRKPRPPRDPNAPTKPQNAFILFQKNVSNQVKAENQGKPWSEIVHLISTRWKALPKEEKEVYEQQYELAKQRFEIEYKAYLESKDQEAASSAADANGHEESNNTSDAATPSPLTSSASSEDDEPKSNLPTKLSKKKSNVHTKDTSKFKKRKSHDDNDNDNESIHEEEENEKPKRKKKEGDEIHEKDQKKVKKSSREVDEEAGSDREEEGKKRRKSKKKSKNY